MALFTYTARDISSRIHRGSMVADSAPALRSRLKSDGLRLLSFSEKTDSKAPQSLLQSLAPRSWLPPRSLDIQLALEQISLMLRNGIGLLQSLESVAEQSLSIRLSIALQAVAKQVSQGSTLAEAMTRQPVFPKIVSQLVVVGESAGDLPLVLERAAKQLAFRRKNWTALISALAYPLFAVLAALGVTFYLVIVVIPELSKFLNSMGRKLPSMTQSLLDVSHWFQTNGTTAMVGTAGAIVFGFWCYTQPQGRALMDRWMLMIPCVGRMLRVAGTITFASTLSVMIRSGFSLIKSLDAIEQLHANRYLASRVAAARSAVERGEGLSSALAVPNSYMPMLASMVAVAEQTGRLEEALDQVSQFYDEQLQAMVKQLSAWMEPVMIVVVGCIVGYVYMAFFIALMSAGGTIR